MDKINLKKMNLESSNIADENFEKLASLFPNVVTETIVDGQLVRAIDKDKLMQEINAHILSENEERYNFTWPDKRKSVVLANAPTRNTLRACKEESKDFDNTENLYIEGDNLEVLKLLRNTYMGQIKMIYIDPPYNTGKDFIYQDNFYINKEEYKEMSGQFDKEGNRLFENTEANGRFHTDWLNMMYPRLKMARDLLSDDGVIFISIDDNEVSNLRKICDEIFGGGNFIVEFIWRKKTGASDAKGIATVTEYILCYLKNISNIMFAFNKNTNSYDINRYKLSDEYVNERGKHYIDNLDRGGIRYSDSLNYPIECPDGSYTYPNGRTEFINDGWVWTWGKDKLKWGIDNGFITFRKSNNKKSGWAVCYKNYVNVDNENNPINRAAPYKNTILDILNTHATIEFRKYFDGQKIFDTPKPVELIKHILKISTGYNENDIILDFFSGSATTAHAVMQLNAEDGGNRKYIMVQLPAETPEDSEARKAGYSTICEIGKERIRRAGEKIKKEYPNANIDTGFRVFKLDSSNMEDVYYKAEDLSQRDIRKTISNIKADRSEEDLLFQIILSNAIPLTCKIEIKKINNRKVYFVNDTYLFVCFENDIDDKTIEELAKMKPSYMVFNQNVQDSTLANIKQIFKMISNDTNIKVI